jgi:hypothetical protein
VTHNRLQIDRPRRLRLKNFNATSPKMDSSSPDRRLRGKSSAAVALDREQLVDETLSQTRTVRESRYAVWVQSMQAPRRLAYLVIIRSLEMVTKHDQTLDMFCVP